MNTILMPSGLPGGDFPWTGAAARSPVNSCTHRKQGHIRLAFIVIIDIRINLRSRFKGEIVE